MQNVPVIKYVNSDKDQAVVVVVRCQCHQSEASPQLYYKPLIRFRMGNEIIFQKRVKILKL